MVDVAASLLDLLPGAAQVCRVQPISCRRASRYLVVSKSYWGATRTEIGCLEKPFHFDHDVSVCALWVEGRLFPKVSSDLIYESSALGKKWIRDALRQL